MRQYWPYCKKCSQVFRKGHLCFWSDDYRSQASRSTLVAPFMEWFWYVSKQTSFLDSIFLLVASVKLYAKIAKSVCFGLSTNGVHQCLTFNCLQLWDTPQLPKIAARSDLLTQGKSFLPASAINRGVFENWWHAFSSSFYHDELPYWLKRLSKMFYGDPLFSDVCKNHLVSFVYLKESMKSILLDRIMKPF